VSWRSRWFPRAATPEVRAIRATAPVAAPRAGFASRATPQVSVVVAVALAKLACRVRRATPAFAPPRMARTRERVARPPAVRLAAARPTAPASRRPATCFVGLGARRARVAETAKPAPMEPVRGAARPTARVCPAAAATGAREPVQPRARTPALQPATGFLAVAAMDAAELAPRETAARRAARTPVRLNATVCLVAMAMGAEARALPAMAARRRMGAAPSSARASSVVRMDAAARAERAPRGPATAPGSAQAEAITSRRSS
jgi:hypothetical protein